jgi:Uma2 family endonuclease
MPDGRIAQNFDLPPDIVVEIVSPGQSVTALMRRCIWYTQNGVAVALLVDPADESVILFRPNQAPRPLGRDDSLVLNDSELPGFSLSLRELFDTLRMP